MSDGSVATASAITMIVPYQPRWLESPREPAFRELAVNVILGEDWTPRPISS